MRKYFYIIAPIIALIVIVACRKDKKVYISTPANIEAPAHFPPMLIPEDNPLTEEGIELGRYLFWEKRLSGDNTMSCGTCHAPEYAFSDDTPTSTGIDGINGTRNSMALVNLAWNDRFFWDGRAMTLEDQILEPVPNPIEMHQSWKDAVIKLQNATNPDYGDMFQKAFGDPTIDSTKVSMAIAQFLRTMISANSTFDAFYKYDNGFQLTASEQAKVDAMTQQERDGYYIFMTETGDCFHCHGGALTQVNKMTNNGLDATFTDPGLMGVTGNANDEGKFKTPSLRNIELSGPYMHDGRFETLLEVVNHYSDGLKASPSIDPILLDKHILEGETEGGIHLEGSEKLALIAFLKTLTDEEFINNPDFQDPFE